MQCFIEGVVEGQNVPKPSNYVKNKNKMTPCHEKYVYNRVADVDYMPLLPIHKYARFVVISRRNSIIVCTICIGIFQGIVLLSMTEA